MNLEKRITELLKPHADKKRAAHDVGYINTKLKTMGCPMAAIRSVAKQVYREIDEFDHADRSKLVDQVWKASNVFDVLYVCLIYFDNRKSENDLKDWQLLQKWSTKIDNWAHSDQLSNIFADLLDRHPSKIYPTLKRWNSSKRPWQRRLSLVSLLGYASQRRNFLSVSKILSQVKPRLGDDHVYVQRAVGWTLRECGQIYPRETKAFIKRHACDLSSIAFTTAVEKWNKTEKEPLKLQRKRQR